MIMYILQGQNGQELHLNICLIFLLQLKDCKMAALSPGGCPIKSFICNWWPNGLKLYNFSYLCGEIYGKIWAIP